MARKKSLADLRKQFNRIADNSPVNGGMATRREMRAHSAFRRYAGNVIDYMDNKYPGLDPFGNKYQNRKVARSVYMGNSNG
ncbi:hypothetical protein [Bacteroides pyogenes]|uniref:hypothetical protein n=1 Tax=Bacteroides pyogenes TaxID=310300 RepID=UPI001BA9AFAB|nr:hypothetical protein [Bacteroides pyogenes]MBR8706997.1 hypothetical protein [Bacteroides pyogenes]